jgi:hypothetical protein
MSTYKLERITAFVGPMTIAAIPIDNDATLDLVFNLFVNNIYSTPRTVVDCMWFGEYYWRMGNNHLARIYDAEAANLALPIE